MFNTKHKYMSHTNLTHWFLYTCRYSYIYKIRIREDVMNLIWNKGTGKVGERKTGLE